MKEGELEVAPANNIGSPSLSKWGCFQAWLRTWK